MSYPHDRKYTETHEWVHLDDDEAIIGITEYASEQLGELVYIELPEVGDRIEAGNECGVVESVKAASDLTAPISGEVTEVNNAAVNDPKQVNDDPHGSGWLLKVKPDDPGEMDDLHEADAYEELLGED
ncbi:glycine cleavage system protein GcvH [bacterium]|nr:glycine cleavage system protein GcvH [bacterium]